jgi:hypothetical protein
MFKNILSFFFKRKLVKDSDLQRFARNEYKKDAEYAYYWMKRNQKLIMSYSEIKNV